LFKASAISVCAFHMYRLIFNKVMTMFTDGMKQIPEILFEIKRILLQFNEKNVHFWSAIWRNDVLVSEKNVCDFN